MSGASRVDAYLRAHIDAGDIPGASWLIGEGDRIVAEGAVGDAVVRPQRIAAQTGTLYDLASLTKPLAGAVVAARLEMQGRLALDAAAAPLLPGWTASGGAAERVTLADLLTHRSGLPAWKALYLQGGGEAAARAAVLRMAPDHTPKRVVYSDPGYILLGLALERAAALPLDRLFEREVTGPLGVSDLVFRPPTTLRPRIAATEAGNRRERLLAGAEGADYNGWPTEIAWGIVHDLNARTLGGVAAHAGLFGTARAVARVASVLLDTGDLLDDQRHRLMTTNCTAGLGEDRSLGFVLASTPGTSAGDRLSRAAFGHTGFTGTSLWIDPVSRRIYILLTNRVHPEDRDIDMSALRRGFHEIAATI